MSPLPYQAPPGVARLQHRELLIGLLGLGLCAAGAVRWHDQLLRSYLFAYLFYLGIALGSLALLLLQHLTDGAWGLILRRPLEAAVGTLPLLLLFFLPVLLGVWTIYPWAHAGAAAASEHLLHKRAYLNVPAFMLRAGGYFAVWLVLGGLLRRWSRAQDESGDPRLAGRMRALAGPGLVLYFLTVTFAAVDWIMSLLPGWYSTLFGLLVIAGQGLSALAFATGAAALLSRREPLRPMITPRHLQDLGGLLLAFVMIWAYLSFSQLLIIWSGNLPEETPWYTTRLRGGWRWLGLALALGHFALPFLLLLSREVKRSAPRLLAVVALLLVMRIADQLWLTAPELHEGRFALHWLDLAALVGLGGVWLAAFAWQLRRRSLWPVHALPPAAAGAAP